MYLAELGKPHVLPVSAGYRTARLEMVQGVWETTKSKSQQRESAGESG